MALGKENLKKIKNLCRGPSLALGKGGLCRGPGQWHSANFHFFCFFDPKFFVGPAYIVYNFMFKFGAFSSFFVIFGWLIWLCWIFIYNSNLNCKCMEYCNLVLRKMLFMVFGVCWVSIHELASNFAHLLHVTWWATLPEKCFKII